MADRTSLIELLLIGVSCMLGFIGIVVYFVRKQHTANLYQQKAMLLLQHQKDEDVLKTIISVQETEKLRIATHIHDSVGAALSLTRLNLSRIVNGELKSKELIDLLKSEIEELDYIYEEISSVSHSLHPAAFNKRGLLRAIEEIVNRTNNLEKIEGAYSSELEENDILIDQGTKLQLWRILQELIQNILKYSQASQIQLSVLCENQMLSVRIKHNGLPFSDEDAKNKIRTSPGIGLVNIENRTKFIKANLSYFSSDRFNGVQISLLNKNVA